MQHKRWPLALLALLLGCGEDEPGPEDDAAALVEPEPAPPAPTLRRLTQEQYRNALADLFGDDLVLPTSLEPDSALDGLLSVGAAHTSISPLGVEQYEDAAYDVAAQAVDEEHRGAVVGCVPAGIVDDDCAASALGHLARRAWRRPVEPAELDTLVTLSGAAAEALGDFHAGLAYGIAAVLQSPSFLYRSELGAPDPDDASRHRFTDWELAARLSFLLWNSIPDDALLDAVEAGELATAEGLEAQALRMLDDPRARRGLRAFVGEWLELYDLDDLTKDPTIFPHFTDGIGPSAREETLQLVEELVFEQDADFRDLLTTRETFLDRNLAMIYGVPAPEREGFGKVELPEEAGRRGLLGHVSLLALHAHPVSTSATLRGKFVREALLCQEIPPPPANLNTSIPEPSADAPTLRERVAVHLENAYCAGCHAVTDPIGLGLENYDGLGLWRTHENDALIDPSGDLDGAPFADASGLAVALRGHPDFGPCVTDTLFAWASGHRPTPSELATSEWLYARFAADGHSLRDQLLTLATSEAFRTAGEME